MPTRLISNSNVTVWWVTSIADYRSPTPAEINAGLNLSAAVSWQNWEVGSTGSADVDDRSIVDVGNAVSRGFPDFGATLAFFRDANQADSFSIYNQAFALFKQPGVAGFLVVRYGQAAPTEVAAAGQFVSVYKFIADIVTDDTEGDDSVKFEVTFLPQGDLREHTLVKTATPVTTLPATSMAITTAGPPQGIKALIGTTEVTSSSTFVSSDTIRLSV